MRALFLGAGALVIVACSGGGSPSGVCLLNGVLQSGSWTSDECLAECDKASVTACEWTGPASSLNGPDLRTKQWDE